MDDKIQFYDNVVLVAAVATEFGRHITYPPLMDSQSTYSGPEFGGFVPYATVHHRPYSPETVFDP